MCFFGKKKTLGDPVGAPGKTAILGDVGKAREEEDEALFGGVPSLLFDRATPAPEGGAGLVPPKTMG